MTEKQESAVDICLTLASSFFIIFGVTFLTAVPYYWITSSLVLFFISAGLFGMMLISLLISQVIEFW
jgi:hypothetical protein